MRLSVDSCYIKHTKKRICQGDIFRDVKYLLLPRVTEDKIEINELIVPYLIILTQECDLDLDYKFHSNTQSEDQDKYLQSILVSPAYIAEKVRSGTHLEGLELKMQNINSRKWSDIKSNQNLRYHYLPKDDTFRIPPLIVDFKHYYTIPRDLFYDKFLDHYIGTLDQLFRESLSHRFSHYLSRIGLPKIKAIEES